MGLLDGKVAIITGAGGGLGEAYAKLFAREGAAVVVNDLGGPRDGSGADLSMAQQVIDAIKVEGGRAVGNGADISTMAGGQSVFDDAIKAFGKVDILINNAGVTQPVKVWDIIPDDWDRIQDVNLRGVLYLSQAMMPHMRAQKAGSIACMSSVSAQRGGGILGGAHYSAAKAGVLGLAKAMARELGPDNIRVNCVAPGLIVTDINIGKIAPEKEKEILTGIPLGRLGQPHDVAKIFLFLASDLSGYTTGAVIDVNGGMHIH
jgi:NAD(P)-dependent dehydrogenase (short-subunit alcohol dehydrogenase family)